MNRTSQAHSGVAIGQAYVFQSPQAEGLRFWRVRGFERCLIFYRPFDNGIEVARHRVSFGRLIPRAAPGFLLQPPGTDPADYPSPAQQDRSAEEEVGKPAVPLPPWPLSAQPRRSARTPRG